MSKNNVNKKIKQKSIGKNIKMFFLTLIIFSVLSFYVSASLIESRDALSEIRKPINPSDEFISSIIELDVNKTDESNDDLHILDEEETEKTTIKEETTAETVKTDENDRHYLAAAICQEAGGESEEVQLLVANVIINRVNSSIYPNTIYGVLTDYMQYGMMWKYGISFPAWADETTIEKCYSIAERILNGERVCPENVLFQAEFEQGSGIYKEIENIYFCYY